MAAKDVLNSLVLWINRFSSKPLFHPFRMTRKEQKLFDRCVSESKNYLEFGMGGSTFRVLQKSQANVYSVDSSEPWIHMMKQYKFIKKMLQSRLSLIHVNIGPTHEWGRPLGESSKHLFPDYSKEVFNKIDSDEIDTVLVDGRFRVSCALSTVKECRNKDLKILFHDFEREHYHVVLKYLDKVESADTLVVLKVKQQLDTEQLEQDYQKYAFDSD